MVSVAMVVEGEEMRKHLARLFMGDVFTQHGEDRVAARNGAEDLGTAAHVDIVGDAGGIAVACLDHREIARECQGEESTRIVGLQVNLSFREKFVLEGVAVLCLWAPWWCATS